jgi:hypothetical protein
MIPNNILDISLTEKTPMTFKKGLEGKTFSHTDRSVSYGFLRRPTFSHRLNTCLNNGEGYAYLSGFFGEQTGPSQTSGIDTIPAVVETFIRL